MVERDFEEIEVVGSLPIGGFDRLVNMTLAGIKSVPKDIEIKSYFFAANKASYHGI